MIGSLRRGLRRLRRLTLVREAELFAALAGPRGCARLRLCGALLAAHAAAQGAGADLIALLAAPEAGGPELRGAALEGLARDLRRLHRDGPSALVGSEAGLDEETLRRALRVPMSVLAAGADPALADAATRAWARLAEGDAHLEAEAERLVADGALEAAMAPLVLELARRMRAPGREPGARS